MGHPFRVLFGAVCAFMCGFCMCHQARGQALPEGKGKAEFVHNCTACHRAEMVTAARKTPEEWRKSVDEMAARGTDGSKEDLDNIVLYLVRNFPLVKPAPDPHGPAMFTLIEREGLKRLNGMDRGGHDTSSHSRSAPSLGIGKPACRYERKDAREPVYSLVRYLLSIPPPSLRASLTGSSGFASGL